MIIDRKKGKKDRPMAKLNGWDSMLLLEDGGHRRSILSYISSVKVGSSNRMGRLISKSWMNGDVHQYFC